MRHRGKVNLIWEVLMWQLIVVIGNVEIATVSEVLRLAYWE
jgi:hypothetical protein